MLRLDYIKNKEQDPLQFVLSMQEGHRSRNTLHHVSNLQIL